MFISEALGINEKGNLTIGGADTTVLAEKYGTPLYLMDENLIVKNISSYKKIISDEYNNKGMVYYASKAFCTKDMCRIAHREGIGLDVVSGGELYTALSAGMPAENLCFHGNNKGYEELVYAIRSGVGRIVADSREELLEIDEIAEKEGKKPSVLLRIKPGISAHTHEFIMTGQEDSKFGVDFKSGEAAEALTTKFKNISLCGVHCHIGSQIFDTSPFEAAADLMISLMADIRNKYGIILTDLDLGGGFGIKYTEEDNPLPYGEYMKKTISSIIAACKKYDFPLPFLSVEPGRSIVGAAGITLYKAGKIKDIKNIRKYVSVDGGMADNPRFILYEAKYDALLPSRPLDDRTELVTISGKCCESGDILIRDIKMPHINTGDLIAVLSTGAYNYSMSSNYNRLPRPAVVMIKDGKDRLSVARETYEDIVRNDL